MRKQIITTILGLILVLTTITAAMATPAVPSEAAAGGNSTAASMRGQNPGTDGLTVSRKMLPGETPTGELIILADFEKILNALGQDVDEKEALVKQYHENKEMQDRIKKIRAQHWKVNAAGSKHSYEEDLEIM